MDAREVVQQALSDLDEAGGAKFVDSLTDDAEMMTQAFMGQLGVLPEPAAAAV